MLTLDRTYAKEILNSIGASQNVTDRERAQIALSYHCLSLLDVFWVKGEKENILFEDINLYTLFKQCSCGYCTAWASDDCDKCTSLGK